MPDTQPALSSSELDQAWSDVVSAVIKSAGGGGYAMTRPVSFTNAMRLAVINRDEMLQKLRNDGGRVVAGAKEQFAKDDDVIGRLKAELAEVVASSSRELSERDARIAAAAKDLKAAEARNEELQRQVAAARQAAEGAGRKAAKSERADVEAAAKLAEEVAQLQGELTATIAARADAERLLAEAEAKLQRLKASKPKDESAFADEFRILAVAKNEAEKRARENQAKARRLETALTRRDAHHEAELAKVERRWRDAAKPLLRLAAKVAPSSAADDALEGPPAEPQEPEAAGPGPGPA
jgi:chromosome segregation ATPase